MPHYIMVAMIMSFKIQDILAKYFRTEIYNQSPQLSYKKRSVNASDLRHSISYRASQTLKQPNVFHHPVKA